LRSQGLTYLRGLRSEPVIILCVSSACLVVSHYQGSGSFFWELFGARFDTHPWSASFSHLWWFAASFFLYLVVPLLTATTTRGSFHRVYGLGLGDARAGIAISVTLLALMVPVTYWASTLPSFKGMYPLGGNAAYLETVDGKAQPSWPLFAVYESGYFCYFVAWEFLFRGWMLNGILKSWGREAALAVQVAPFAVMHLGKAELEALGSIPAGLALGLLALRTRSFWYGAFLHGSIAVWMDWLSARKFFV
jgi:uncharacterized protein